ncbi:probable aspartyl protease At4g16563 [Vitis riparia]|uniref:probable aspartyl protease At4g16563 n=1 Tax=Vitis riparia TaxID=96939 RepID=UPI00155B28E6|nr:probable aspartyl protease At4g16563 [Vitis riparia]
MASSTSLLFSVLTLFSLLLLASSSKDNTPATITIPLTSTFTNNPSTKPLRFHQHLATASLSRAHHLKHGKTSPLTQISLSPHSYGGHSIPLSFGTPPQKLSFLVDTGSHVVWAPCTTHYTCTNCSFSDAEPKKVPIFNPKLSSSSKILGCRNPKCVDTSSPDVHLGCPRCNGNSKNCSHACPPYSLQYGTGASSGDFLLENLNFPGKTIHEFLVGCTTSAVGEVTSAALAGFGRSLFSLPMQMGVKKFAYCLNSHDYDDTRNSSKLILDYSDGETKGLSYAPFLKNPPDFPIYYYLGVKDIKIGNKLLRIPSKYLAPGSDGRGGLMIDSGFAYGYMTGPVFKKVTNELKKQMSKYRRSLEAEAEIGVTPCYNFTGHKSIKIPDLIYQFRGGATMVVPGKNYFVLIPEISLACFPLTTDAGTYTLEFTPGPSIILGNSQHVDYYVEFDLKNERLGFRQQTC